MSKVRRFAAYTLTTLISLALSGILITTLICIYIEWQFDIRTLREVQLQGPLRVYTADGKLMAQFGVKRRIPVKLDEIPKQLVQAVLATEDVRFYEHPGVDLIGMIRAVKAVLISGKRSQGASTITMQVARNFFLTRKKTYSRKINEILLALKIDKELSKDKILELYLNKIYFGNRAYGVAAAARVYYGKSLDQLNLAQLAMIAGLPQAPSKNNPLDNPQGAWDRRAHVLRRMLELGFITQEEHDRALNEPLTATYHAETVEVQAPYVAEMVRQEVIDKYGEDAYERGLSVYTTISSVLQEHANHSLRNGLMAYDKRHGYRKPVENLGVFNRDDWLAALKKKDLVKGMPAAAVVQVKNRSIQVIIATGEVITVPWEGLSWARPALKEGSVGFSPNQASDIVKVADIVYVMKDENGQWWLTQIPEVEGGLIAMDPSSGAILALNGGFDYGHSSFNRVTQAFRQPGSNFKPFLYSAALDKGYTLATMINDAPVVIEDSGENELWRPMNDTRKFYGPTSLRVGLTKSRNLVSIRLLQEIGIPYAIEYLTRFGFDSSELPRSLSLALGTAVFTPLQIAAGYSIFANGGFRVKPYLIERIEDPSHQILFQAKPERVPLPHPGPVDDSSADKPIFAQQVITPQNAYLITHALREVILHGTGSAARILNRADLAGKTGTTNDQVDAWFSGFNSKLEATVWVGFDNSHSLYEYGAQAALPIWIQFMQSALEGQPESALPEPPDIVRVRIDPQTGLLASPDQKNAFFEIFRKRYAPTQFSSSITTRSFITSDTDQFEEEDHLF